MDRQNRVIPFLFWRQYHVAQGWAPSWDKYTRWLKERKYRAEKMRLEKEAREKRMRQNDRVLRSYGLGKYQRKDY